MTKLNALDKAIDAAGSQIALCRYLGKPQSSIWTWYNNRCKGPSPETVPALVALTRGECTAPDFRPDIYDWQRRIEHYLKPEVPADAAIAGMQLLWMQIPELEAVPHLMETRGWNRARARAAVDHLTDNGLGWFHNTDQQGAA